jgi:prevent-host-death family protein
MAPKNVGAFDAKTNFSRLLARVVRGESITITRHGTPVARLVPATPSRESASKSEIVARFKAFARNHRIGRPGLKALREEGRM